MVIKDFRESLGTSKVLDGRRRGVPTRRISNTPQGETIEGNAADDTLMLDQGYTVVLDMGITFL